jgi:hypothetical protein
MTEEVMAIPRRADFSAPQRRFNRSTTSISAALQRLKMQTTSGRSLLRRRLLPLKRSHEQQNDDDRRRHHCRLTADQPTECCTAPDVTAPVEIITPDEEIISAPYGLFFGV